MFSLTGNQKLDGSEVRITKSRFPKHTDVGHEKDLNKRFSREDSLEAKTKKIADFQMLIVVFSYV